MLEVLSAAGHLTDLIATGARLIEPDARVMTGELYPAAPGGLSIRTHDLEPGSTAPYPGLASLGTLDDSRLLLNLEAVPGIVSLTGAPADREAVLASLAAELATNGWSDRPRPIVALVRWPTLRRPASRWAATVV